jgi:hypothetical protein
MNILKKIQKELKAPKNQRNSFGNYNYRSCEDILEAVKPLLEDAILTLNDEIVHFETSQELKVVELVDGKGKTYTEIIGGDRFYIKATATFKEGDKEISVSAYAREPQNKKGMDEAQITGATSSYARKYALNGLFLIDDTKDADTMDNSKSIQAEAKTSNIEDLKTEADKCQTIDDLKKFYAKHKGLGKDFDNHIALLAKKLGK